MTQQHATSASAADAKARRIDQLSARADQAEACGDFPTLVRLRETILRLAPDWNGTAFNVGYAHELASKHADHIGDLRAATRHRQRAEIHYRRELQRDPRCAVTHNNLGNLRASEARGLKAANPAAAMHAIQEAIALHTVATQLDPRYAIAAYNLGGDHAELAALLADTDLRAARRHWAQAAKSLSRALRLDPTYAAAAGRAGDALAAEARAIADDEPRAALALWIAALDRHARALRLEPGDTTAAIDCGNDLLHIAEMTFAHDRRAAHRLWNDARRHYRLALRLDPTLDIAEHDLGTACFDEATALADIDPKRAMTLLLSAEAHYAAALVLAPDAHDNARSLGDTLALQARLIAATDLPEARRRWRRATRCLQRVQRKVPDDRWPTVLLARATIAEAEALAPVDPQSALRLRRLASRRYRSLLRLPLPAIGAGDCYSYAQQVCEGAENELNPRAASSRALWRRAADGFLEAARRNPRHAWAWNDAAYALACLALTWRDAAAAQPVTLRAEVIRCCKQALRINPAHHAAHTQLGNICATEACLACDARADDLWQQAIAHHQKSLALRPDKSFSLSCLAWVHADQADALATRDAAAATDARAAALAYIAEAQRTAGADADGVRTAQALIDLRFAGADASPEARQYAMQRVARRLLKQLDRRAASRAAALALARAAAEAALGQTEACTAALELAVLLGELTDVDDIDDHPAFDAVREDAGFQRWRRSRFGAARPTRR
ncbi:hypothetical protein [Nevskia sp.]|uniref:hypothetical protein n=1 Tax=Nevskia sp. TaxID=1929292 RepID=UPI0025FA10D5|nr:hypothetical protein [Nevskia sp.]